MKKAVALSIWIISLVLIVNAIRTIAGYWQRKALVEGREEVLTSLKEETRQLEETLRLTDDLENIERVARDKLGLVKEGETIVLLPRTQNPELNDQENTSENIPNWKKWWRLFF